MAMDSNTSPMAIFIEGNTKMVDSMGLVFMSGNRRWLFMKEILKMGSDKAKGNGRKERQNIMGDTYRVSKKGMGNCTTRPETFIKVISLRTRKTVMERCFGRTVVSTKANGNMEYRMAKAKCF